MADEPHPEPRVFEQPLVGIDPPAASGTFAPVHPVANVSQVQDIVRPDFVKFPGKLGHNGIIHEIRVLGFQGRVARDAGNWEEVNTSVDLLRSRPPRPTTPRGFSDPVRARAGT
ncbi:MAG: hypothetical protein RBG13Loki_0904 [Promethearchaeota archaeon CR_4]|nr:MAG: hypothetical protein RBG13Loki_0904 [Candidatus Lokiarchaeota archaeon CR_4]